MGKYIVGLKITNYSSIATVIKIMREFSTESYSEIKSKAEKNEYLLCYDCADRDGIKAIIACYEKLTANSVGVALFDLDHRETTIENMKIRCRRNDEIANEIESEI